MEHPSSEPGIRLSGAPWRGEQSAPPTLVINGSLRDLPGDSHLMDLLSREILPAYLGQRRWFGSKGETLNAARLVALLPLDPAQDILIGVVEAELEGHTEIYLLPLSVVWDGTEPTALQEQLALGPVRGANRAGLLTDGFATQDMARSIIHGLKEHRTLTGPGGTLEFSGSEALDRLSETDGLRVHWLSAEQSNSSLIIGDIAMVKLIRHVFPGIHPEVEMTRYLTRLGYRNTAPLLGEVARIAPDGQRYTLIIAQGALRNQGDAWSWMLALLRQALDAAAEGEDEDRRFKPLYDFSAKVGTRLGELHAALATPTDDPDFRPEPMSDTQVEQLRQTIRREVSESLDILAVAGNGLAVAGNGLAAAGKGLEPGLSQAVASLLGHREALLSRAEALAQAGRGTLMIRHHGDFHLGQILVADGDAYLIDFEGEPARALEERRAKSSPLRDVAGLLRSLDYLGATAEREAAAAHAGDEAGSGAQAERRALIRSFTEKASDTFLDHYYRAAASAPSLGLGTDKTQAILDFFLLEKTVYEVAYEARNRPHWLPIPLSGLTALWNRLSETSL